MKSLSLALVAFAAATAVSNAQIRVTEYSHKGLFGEYFEVANLGSSQSISGYKFNDNSGTASTGIALPAVTLNTNDVVIVTEISAVLFDQAWYGERGVSAPATLKGYVENSTRNLGKTDEIRIFDTSSNQVDTVSITTGFDTEDRPAVLDSTHTNVWVFANAVGVTGQFKAGTPGANGPIGSPGVVAP